MALRVGYQGNHGTFSEIAVRNYFCGQAIEPLSYKNFTDIMNDCDNGTLDYALLPVENTTTGIIFRTYDLFKEHHVHACGEIIVPIVQNLITLPGAKLAKISEVYSHPEALSQCQNFFQLHPGLQAIAWQDTAAAVELVKGSNDLSKAAVGSELAAEYYDMNILVHGVQDSTTNMTRFFCVTAKEEPVPSDGDKVSIMLELDHKPGALYHALGILSYADINVLKLESRPIQGEPFHYCFYVDFSGNLEDPFVKTAMAKLRQHSNMVKVLGCYKAAVSMKI